MLHLVIEVVDAEMEEPVSADVAVDDHSPDLQSRAALVRQMPLGGLACGLVRPRLSRLR